MAKLAHDMHFHLNPSLGIVPVKALETFDATISPTVTWPPQGNKAARIYDENRWQETEWRNYCRLEVKK